MPKFVVGDCVRYVDVKNHDIHGPGVVTEIVHHGRDCCVKFRKVNYVCANRIHSVVPMHKLTRSDTAPGSNSFAMSTPHARLNARKKPKPKNRVSSHAPPFHSLLHPDVVEPAAVLSAAALVQTDEHGKTEPLLRSRGNVYIPTTTSANTSSTPLPPPGTSTSRFVRNVAGTLRRVVDTTTTPPLCNSNPTNSEPAHVTEPVVGVHRTPTPPTPTTTTATTATQQNTAELPPSSYCCSLTQPQPAEVDPTTGGSESMLSGLSDIEVDHSSTKLGSFPLHIACRMNKPNTVQTLLTRGGNPNGVDNRGNSPLHECVLNYAIEFLELRLVDTEQPSLLHHGNMLQCARILIQAGANIQLRNRDGESPLDLAMKLPGPPTSLIEVLCTASTRRYTHSVGVGTGSSLPPTPARRSSLSSVSTSSILTLKTSKSDHHHHDQYQSGTTQQPAQRRWSRSRSTSVDMCYQPTPVVAHNEDVISTSAALHSGQKSPSLISNPTVHYCNPLTKQLTDCCNNGTITTEKSVSGSTTTHHNNNSLSSTTITTSGNNTVGIHEHAPLLPPNVTTTCSSPPTCEPFIVASPPRSVTEFFASSNETADMTAEFIAINIPEHGEDTPTSSSADPGGGGGATPAATLPTAKAISPPKAVPSRHFHATVASHTPASSCTTTDSSHLCKMSTGVHHSKDPITTITATSCSTTTEQHHKAPHKPSHPNASKRSRISSTARCHSPQHGPCTGHDAHHQLVSPTMPTTAAAGGPDDGRVSQQRHQHHEVNVCTIPVSAERLIVAATPSPSSPSPPVSEYGNLHCFPQNPPSPSPPPSVIAGGDSAATTTITQNDGAPHIPSDSAVPQYPLPHNCKLTDQLILSCTTHPTTTECTPSPVHKPQQGNTGDVLWTCQQQHRGNGGCSNSSTEANRKSQGPQRRSSSRACGTSSSSSRHSNSADGGTGNNKNGLTVSEFADLLERLTCHSNSECDEGDHPASPPYVSPDFERTLAGKQQEFRRCSSDPHSLLSPTEQRRSKRNSPTTGCSYCTCSKDGTTGDALCLWCKYFVMSNSKERGGTQNPAELGVILGPKGRSKNRYKATRGAQRGTEHQTVSETVEIIVHEHVSSEKLAPTVLNAKCEPLLATTPTSGVDLSVIGSTGGNHTRTVVETVTTETYQYQRCNHNPTTLTTSTNTIIGNTSAAAEVKCGEMATTSTNTSHSATTATAVIGSDTTPHSIGHNHNRVVTQQLVTAEDTTTNNAQPTLLVSGATDTTCIATTTNDTAAQCTSNGATFVGQPLGPTTTSSEQEVLVAVYDDITKLMGPTSETTTITATHATPSTTTISDTSHLVVDAVDATTVVVGVEDANSHMVTDSNGRTALHLAIRNSAESCILALLDTPGINVNQAEMGFQSQWRLLPQHLITCRLDVSTNCVSSLLEKCNDVNVSIAFKGLTPLHLACIHNNTTVTKVLIEQGADPCLDSIEPEGWYPLHFAAYHNHSACIRILLQNVTTQCTQQCNHLSGHANTPVHIAAMRGNSNCISEICIHGGQHVKINQLNSHGSSALHLACYYLHNQCCTVLLTYGADPNLPSAFGWCPLHYVTTAQHHNVTVGETTGGIGSAVLNKHMLGATTEVIVRQLVMAGAELQPSGNKLPPLHLGCQVNNCAAVEALAKSGAKLGKVKGNIGGYIDELTALHFACVSGNKDIIQLLLDMGADPTEPSGGTADTPLHLSCWLGKSDCVAALCGKDVVNARNNDGATALHICAIKGNTQCALVLTDLGKPDLDTVLVEAHYGTSLHANHQLTPLHEAILQEHIDMVDVLVTAGADLQKRTCTFQSAMHCALHVQNTDIISYLWNHYLNLHTNHISHTNGSSIGGTPTTNINMDVMTINIIAPSAVTPSTTSSPSPLASNNHNEALPICSPSSYGGTHLVPPCVVSNADVPTIPPKGMQLLTHYCAVNGLTQALEHLISSSIGCSIWTINTSHQTLLHVACIAGSEPTINWFLHNTQNQLFQCNKKGSVDTHHDAPHDTPHDAPHHSNNPSVVGVADLPGIQDMWLALDETNQTPLFCAVVNGNVDILKLILGSCNKVDTIARSINIVESTHNHSPLIAAITENYLEIAILLLQYGADVTQVSSTQQTALHIACSMPNMVPLFPLLKPWVSTNIKNGSSSRAIANSRILGRTQKQIDINSLDQCSNSPLHYAAYMGNSKAVHYLLHQGADPTITNNEGSTALTLCINASHIDCIRAMVQYWPPVLNVQNNDNTTPLDWALHVDNQEVIQFLMRYTTRRPNPNNTHNGNASNFHTTKTLNGRQLVSLDDSKHITLCAERSLSCAHPPSPPTLCAPLLHMEQPPSPTHTNDSDSTLPSVINNGNDLTHNSSERDDEAENVHVVVRSSSPEPPDMPLDMMSLPSTLPPPPTIGSSLCTTAALGTDVDEAIQPDEQKLDHARSRSSTPPLVPRPPSPAPPETTDTGEGHHHQGTPEDQGTTVSSSSTSPSTAAMQPPHTLMESTSTSLSTERTLGATTAVHNKAATPQQSYYTSTTRSTTGNPATMSSSTSGDVVAAAVAASTPKQLQPSCSVDVLRGEDSGSMTSLSFAENPQPRCSSPSGQLPTIDSTWSTSKRHGKSSSPDVNLNAATDTNQYINEGNSTDGFLIRHTSTDESMNLLVVPPSASSSSCSNNTWALNIVLKDYIGLELYQAQHEADRAYMVQLTACGSSNHLILPKNRKDLKDMEDDLFVCFDIVGGPAEVGQLQVEVLELPTAHSTTTMYQHNNEECLLPNSHHGVADSSVLGVAEFNLDVLSGGDSAGCGGGCCGLPKIPSFSSDSSSSMGPPPNVYHAWLSVIHTDQPTVDPVCRIHLAIWLSWNVYSTISGSRSGSLGSEQKAFGLPSPKVSTHGKHNKHNSWKNRRLITVPPPLKVKRQMERPVVPTSSSSPEPCNTTPPVASPAAVTNLALQNCDIIREQEVQMMSPSPAIVVPCPSDPGNSTHLAADFLLGANIGFSTTSTPTEHNPTAPVVAQSPICATSRYGIHPTTKRDIDQPLKNQGTFHRTQYNSYFVPPDQHQHQHHQHKLTKDEQHCAANSVMHDGDELSVHFMYSLWASKAIIYHKEMAGLSLSCHCSIHNYKWHTPQKHINNLGEVQWDEDPVHFQLPAQGAGPRQAKLMVDVLLGSIKWGCGSAVLPPPLEKHNTPTICNQGAQPELWLYLYEPGCEVKAGKLQFIWSAEKKMNDVQMDHAAPVCSMEMNLQN